MIREKEISGLVVRVQTSHNKVRFEESLRALIRCAARRMAEEDYAAQRERLD